MFFLLFDYKFIDEDGGGVVYLWFTLQSGSKRPYLGEVPCQIKENSDGDEDVELKHSIELMDS